MKGTPMPNTRYSEIAGEKKCGSCFVCTKPSVGWGASDLHFILTLKNVCAYRRDQIQKKLAALDASEPQARREPGSDD